MSFDFYMRVSLFEPRIEAIFEIERRTADPILLFLRSRFYILPTEPSRAITTPRPHTLTHDGRYDSVISVHISEAGNLAEFKYTQKP
jgi:hypothetical protein